MEAAIESLTTSEAAIAAGVTVAKINRMIDKRILPKMLYKAAQNRTVRKDACLWIAFYFETEDVLTSSARVKAMRNALAHNHSWTELRQCKFEESRTCLPRFLSRHLISHNASPVSPESTPKCERDDDHHAPRQNINGRQVASASSTVDGESLEQTAMVPIHQYA